MFIALDSCGIIFLQCGPSQVSCALSEAVYELFDVSVALELSTLWQMHSVWILLVGDGAVTARRATTWCARSDSSRLSVQVRHCR